MKIALLGDTHWGLKNDDQRFLDYFARFFDEVFFPYIDEHDIKHVIHLGDLVDKRKNINYLTLEFLQHRFLDKLVDRNINTYFVAGNHDVYYKNTNKLNTYNGLFRKGYDRVYYYTKPIDLYVSNSISLSSSSSNDTKILLIPWITPETHDEVMKRIETSDADILLGHLEVVGAVMQQGIEAKHGLSQKMFDKFELTCSGHFHYKGQYGKVFYLGCPFQMSWTDVGAENGFYIIDSETQNFDAFIENPLTIYEKVHYKKWKEQETRDFSLFDKKFVRVFVENRNEEKGFKSFLSDVYGANPYSVEIVESGEDVTLSSTTTLEDIKDNRDIITTYVDNADVSVDKDELKSYFLDLYEQANMVEDDD